MLTQQDQQTLLELARQSIGYGLQHKAVMPVELKNYTDALHQHGASFVTLKINNSLRGCVGSLQAYQPLVVDIVQHAYAAAFQDTRFSPVTETEYPELHYHISVLEKPLTLPVNNEVELLDTLVPGIDGVILEDGPHKATFLPSVWESLETPVQFIQQLKLKAGLPANHWSSNMVVKTYKVEEFSSE